MRKYEHVLLALLIIGATVVPVHTQESRSPATVDKVIKTLNSADVSSFKSSLRLPFDVTEKGRDETVRSSFAYDGQSKFLSTWFRLFYDRDNTLVMRNHEQFMSRDVHRYHRWWIRGHSSAFVDAGSWSVSDLMDTVKRDGAGRIRTLVTVLYQIQLFPARLEENKVKVTKTDSTYRLRFRKKTDQGKKRMLDVFVDRSRKRITRIRFVEQASPSFYSPEKQRISLKIPSYHRSGILPLKATFTDRDNGEHLLSFSYNPPADRETYDPEPNWFEPKRTSPDQKQPACRKKLFPFARNANFLEEDNFRKRLSVHRNQIDRITSCYDQLQEKKQEVDAAERELKQALTFSTDSSYVPSWRTSDTDNLTAFMVFLRMVRLVKQGELTPEKTGAISLPSIYTTGVQLLAFRSSIRSIKQAGAFTRQLNRITGKYPLQTAKLFVRELEHRLRGKGEEKGLIQKQGKQYLASVQEESDPTAATNVLMGRLYYKLGYFQKADKAYASVTDRRNMLPEVKEFIRSARTKAQTSLQALPINVLTPKELLYMAGVKAKENNIASLRKDLNTFLNMYRDSTDTILYLKDVYILRKCLQLLLNDHRDLVRSVLKEVLKRENGYVLSKSYTRSVVESAYGTGASDLYELVRFLRTPDRVKSFMSLKSAVDECLAKLKNGNGERVDYLFLARATPFLLNDNTEEVATWLTHLKAGRKKFSNPVLDERTGDLFLKKGNRKKAADAYRGALKHRLIWLTDQEGPRLKQDVPSFEPPYTYLLEDNTKPEINQPLPIKYGFVSKKIDRTKKAIDLLETLSDTGGQPSNWKHIVRDPGAAANFELQYSGWGLYFLGEKSTGLQILRTGAKRERGQYPFGSFTNSATNGLTRLLLFRGNVTDALNTLRRAADRELDHVRTFSYRGNAGEAYVRLAEEEDQTTKAITYLQQAAKAEWLRMSSFTYEDSATQHLVNLLFDHGQTQEALHVMNLAFFRSLVEQPAFTSGTAPYEFVQKLKEHRHTVDALVVAREFSKVYASDPDPLRREIISLQNTVENASLTRHFTNRFSQDPSQKLERTIDNKLETSNLDDLSTGNELIDRLSTHGHGVISVLEKRRQTVPTEKQKQFNQLIRLLGWEFVRGMYKRPDFLQPNVFE